MRLSSAHLLPSSSNSFRARHALLLLVFAAAWGCGGGGGEAVAELRPPLVEAVAARAGTLPLEETVNGVVKARNQVDVRSEIAAPVVEVMAESGDAVARGQALVRLREDESRDQLRQAEADVRLAEAGADVALARVTELAARIGRTRTLAAEELVSTQELEVQEAQLASLHAGVEQAASRVEQAMATADERRTALARTVVRSPVAGRVGQRHAEVGMQVDSGDVLFVVGDLDEMRVEVPLTGEMLDGVAPGMPVRIEPQGAGEPIAAALSRISPFLAEESFTTVGEIDVDNRNGRLRPGMFVTVRILYGESRRATLVPASAVWEDPGSGVWGVFVVEDAAGLGSTEDVAVASEKPRATVFRPVKVLAAGGGTVGVEGVGEGDWVVVVGQHLLKQRAEDDARRQGAEGADGTGCEARPVARVRPTSWERVQELQSLQREDLLAAFLDKQQRIAAALGPEIPESEAVVDRVLGKGDAAAAAGGN